MTDQPPTCRCVVGAAKASHVRFIRGRYVVRTIIACLMYPDEDAVDTAVRLISAASGTAPVEVLHMTPSERAVNYGESVWDLKIEVDCDGTGKCTQARVWFYVALYDALEALHVLRSMGEAQ